MTTSRWLPLILAACSTGASAQAPGTRYQFDLGPGPVAPGHVKVEPSTVYDPSLGYGYEPGSKVVPLLGGDSVTSDRPFSFSVAVPEGNYRVTVKLGGPSGPSTTTVKAESRRLMLESVALDAGPYVDRTFTVNVRTPKIASGGVVKLKARERDVLHWDDKLTFEFLDIRPAVAAIELIRVDDAITVYLAGDSTVTDQPREPWNSWGQMLPRFFKPGVAVANHAESGEALRSFESEKRLEKVLSVLKPGDYLFIQFGHNDQKERGPNVGALTTYKASLQHYVAQARSRGAWPVVVTPVSRRAFGPEGKIVNNLGDYPEAVRQVAQEDKVPLIDLNALSIPFYEALGVEGSKQAFVDNTHHNNYGSYELARCVVEGIRKAGLKLADQLVDDLPPFDPARPDPPAAFRLPASPPSASTTPDGS